MKLKLKKNVKQIASVLLVVVLILLCLLFLKTRVTYSSYESKVDSSIKSNVAGWNIKIDGKNIASEQSSKGININDIVWDNTNVRDGKVAPGSTGKMKLLIDPTGTDVAIYFELEVVDKSVDPNKFLTISKLSFSNSTVRRIAPNKYAGILTLDQINKGDKVTFNIDLLWDNTEDIVYDEEKVGNLDSFLVFNFFAKQYQGEELPPEYVEAGI